MNMTDEQMRIAIAEACGWKPTTDSGICWDCNGAPIVTPPDYLNDLNAMHEAEKVLIGLCKEGDFWFYLRTLLDFPEGESDWCSFYFFQAIHATARQRAIAFIKTLNLEPK